MNRWLTTVPSRLACPIAVKLGPFAHHTWALSTASPWGLPAEMKDWLATLPSMLARPIVPELRSPSRHGPCRPPPLGVGPAGDEGLVGAGAVEVGTPDRVDPPLVQ